MLFLIAVLVIFLRHSSHCLLLSLWMIVKSMKALWPVQNLRVLENYACSVA